MKKLILLSFSLISLNAHALDLKALGQVDFSKSIQETEAKKIAKEREDKSKQKRLKDARNQQAQCFARNQEQKESYLYGTSFNNRMPRPAGFDGPAKFDAETQSWGNAIQ